MVKVPVNHWTAIALYFLAVTGICAVNVKLAATMAKHTIALALPHLDNSPPKLSLIERRRMDATLAAPPLAHSETIHVAILEPPVIPAGTFAAQLDLAEKSDVGESPQPMPVAISERPLEPTSYPSSIATRIYGYRMKVRSADRREMLNIHSVTAADIFNRSFGVQSVRPD